MLDADESLTPAACEAIGEATMRATPSVAGFLMCQRIGFSTASCGSPTAIPYGS